MANIQPRPGLNFDDPDLREALGLNWTPKDGKNWLTENVSVHRVKRLSNKEIFPPENVFWAENDKAKQDWDEAWKDCPLADSRKGKSGKKDQAEERQIVVEDRSRFKHVLTRGKAGIFLDEDTEEVVFARLPNIIRHGELLAAINDVCKKVARENRCDRRDDPGAIASAGYTIGNRKKAAHPTGEGRGQLLKHMSSSQRARVWYEDCSMATLVWNIIKYRLPPVVLSDFDDCIEKHNLPRMDGGTQGKEYSVWTSDQKKEYRFSFEEAGPPRIACAINYARFCHSEKDKNEYAVSFTTRATAKPATGGNFFVAQYGILSEQESDTITLWRVKDFHGTSLYPRAPARQTSGLAFVIPPGPKELETARLSEHTMEEIRATPRPKVNFSRQQKPGKKMAEHVNREGVEASDIDTESDEEGDYVAGTDVVQELHGDQDNLAPGLQWLMDEMADRADEEMGDEDDDQPAKGNKRSKSNPVESIDEESGDSRSKRRKVETTDGKPTPGKAARRGRRG